MARHLTPQYIYQPRYTAHPNGATLLSDTIVVVDDVDRFAAKYRAYLAAVPVRDRDSSRFSFALGDHLTLVHWRDSGLWLPGSLLPPLPCIAGVVFRVPDLAAQRARLQGAGFSVRAAGKHLLVPAEEACGVAVLFES